MKNIEKMTALLTQWYCQYQIPIIFSRTFCAL